MTSSSSVSNLSDLELVNGFRKGNVMCFEALYDRYVQKIFRFATNLTGNETEALDISQEVFLKLLERIDSFQGRGSFKSWLFTMTRNFVIDSHRKRAVKTVLLGSGTDLETFFRTEQDAPQGPGYDLELLDRLPAEVREILLLRVIEGLPYSEIASITGTVEARLRKIVFQTLRLLGKEETANELRKDN
jgi:RNA polymerase sigma-70 factor, ECF subfamily